MPPHDIRDGHPKKSAWSATDTQQDDPPREAVEALGKAIADCAGYRDEPARFLAGTVLLAANRLPAAARWRLIAWLAEGLEPTMEMKRVVLDNGGHVALGYAMAALPDMLAAARAEEARDG